MNIEIYSEKNGVYICPFWEDVDTLIYLKEHGLEPMTNFYKTLKHLISVGF